MKTEDWILIGGAAILGYTVFKGVTGFSDWLGGLFGKKEEINRGDLWKSIALNPQIDVLTKTGQPSPLAIQAGYTPTMTAQDAIDFVNNFSNPSLSPESPNPNPDYFSQYFSASGALITQPSDVIHASGLGLMRLLNP